MLLFGASLIYGFCGGTAFVQISQALLAGKAGEIGTVIGLVFVVAGLAFKVSAVPFHMWTPDVYEGAPTPVTGFMAAATKAVALALALRLLSVAFHENDDLWTIALAVLACISLAWGNIAALVQTNVKRLLAYSSISHAGFMLIAIAAGNELGGRALLYYLIPYSAISVGAFAVVVARERELGEPVTLANLAGFGWERPLLGVSMATFMLGFAGFPLTGGFMGKFLVFSAASDSGWDWLVIVGVLATLVSLYYYLAIIRSMYMRPAAELGLAPIGGSPPREIMLSSAAFLAMVVNVGSFFAVQPLVDFARGAADSLPL
jgi:NADH-quinone oxidoreductase subunit N